MSNQTKAKVFAFIRTILTAAGTFIIGANVMGVTVEPKTWEIVVGAFMTIIATWWGYDVKGSAEERNQSLTRHGISSAGGFVTALGISPIVASGGGDGAIQTITTIIGFILQFLPRLQKLFSNRKIKGIENNTLVVDHSRGVPSAVNNTRRMGDRNYTG